MQGAGGEPFWLITQPHVVRAALLDRRLTVDRAFASAGHSGFRLPPPLDGNLLGHDGADHARLRRFAAPAFTARRTRHLRQRIDAVSRRLLARLTAQPRADLVADYALPLPLTLVTDLLGIPLAEQPALTQATRTLLTYTRHEQLADSVNHVHQLLADLVTRRHHQQHKEEAQHGHDLLSAWLHAPAAHRPVSEDELTALAFQLWWAGIENVTHAIAHGALLLLTHPEQAQLLRDRPALLPAAVEELLARTTPTTTAAPRYAREDLTLAGTLIRAGETLLLSLTLSPTHHHNTGPLTLTRPPRPHLAFGHGPHHCLGTTLARTQLHTALTHLLHQPHLTLAIPQEQLRRRKTLRLNGLHQLPVTP
ncbi:cytochrome P450 [Streptomyces sp. NPDC048603]|uniref:cytochrome P450 n=1 Tax=Streptomyces sp. NPDC048603 TaxID=3365577 RepID=UPI0037122BE1